MAPANGKVTLAIIATELRLLTQAVNKLGTTFEQHIKDDQEVAKIVDRLDQKDKSRTWQFQAMWTAIAGGAVAFIINLFRTQ